MRIREEDIGRKLHEVGWKQKGYQLMAFTPTLGELYYQGTYPFRKTAKQIVRYILEFLQSRYTVYYLIDENREIVGQCTTQKTGHGRYAVLGKEAIMIGPYAIEEKFRGRGLAPLMLAGVLEQFPKGSVFYDWIQKGNAASIATTKKVGGIPVNGMTLSPFLRRFKMGDIEYGDYLLVKIQK